MPDAVSAMPDLRHEVHEVMAQRDVEMARVIVPRCTSSVPTGPSCRSRSPSTGQPAPSTAPTSSSSTQSNASTRATRCSDYRTRPDLKLGICGKHGGDPDSIPFFHRIGLDYVSCSPYRVPVARLEAGRAQALDAR